MKRALPDPHFGRQIDHEPFVPTQPGTPRVPGGSIGWRVFPNQSADDVLMEPHRPIRRAKALRVQLRGDRDERPAHGTEFPDAGHHAVEIGGMLVPADRTDQHMTGLLTARPGDGHADPITDALDLHFDPLDEEPDDLLAVGRCGRRGVPQRR